MTAAVAGTVSLVTLLKLGRVSNLPTVWTNVLVGTLIGGGAAQSGRVGLVALAMTLFYLGGMYLNDYFDRAIDARERPERPIPAQEISPSAVCAIGFGLLAAAVVLMAALGVAAAASAFALAAAIVAYAVVMIATAPTPKPTREGEQDDRAFA